MNTVDGLTNKLQARLRVGLIQVLEAVGQKDGCATFFSAAGGEGGTLGRANVHAQGGRAQQLRLLHSVLHQHARDFWRTTGNGHSHCYQRIHKRTVPVQDQAITVSTPVCYMLHVHINCFWHAKRKLPNSVNLVKENTGIDAKPLHSAVHIDRMVRSKPLAASSSGVHHFA